MNFGLRPEEWLFIEATVLVPLRTAGAQAWVFGSRARGDHHRYSDLDIMASSQDDIFPLLAAIRERLQIGNFPYKVDLVARATFAASYLPSFERDKVQVA